MSHADNIMVVRRATVAINARDWDALHEVMAPDLVAGFTGSPFMAAFPDVQITTDEEWADGDRVITRWTDRATHRGEFMGIPATGVAVSLSGMSIDRIADGKIVESYSAVDMLALVQQLGATIAPPKAREAQA